MSGFEKKHHLTPLLASLCVYVRHCMFITYELDLSFGFGLDADATGGIPKSGIWIVEDRLWTHKLRAVPNRGSDALGFETTHGHSQVQVHEHDGGYNYHVIIVIES